MQTKKQAKDLFFFLTFTTCLFLAHLHADVKVERNRTNEENRINQASLESYLLPTHHPLQHYMDALFADHKMFRSEKDFKRSGFRVKRGHRKLMVGGHPSVPQYLFKKFPDSRSQIEQLENFIKRIEGAKILREYIEKHQFKHLVIPQKWLYRLPKKFSGKDSARSYVLIVDNMNICNREENLELYYNMDIEVLTELCMILHDVGGCDAFPRNQPFTRSGKIAFVDTEHVGRMKGHFIKHVIPALNQELQAYAISLWLKLEEEERQHKHALKEAM